MKNSLERLQIIGAIDNVLEEIEAGKRLFELIYNSPPSEPWSDADQAYVEANLQWHFKNAYFSLAILAESLELPNFLLRVTSLSTTPEALLEKTIDPDQDIHSAWGFSAQQLTLSLKSVYGDEGERTFTKDIESILRQATYSITNQEIFPTPPQSEADVHRRVEAVLRCIFPNLVHKPRLGKPIKNFEPDIGLPSIQTLIEFKFIASMEDVRVIADQILADTRGYTSKEYTHFIYAIYETERFRPELEWNQLFRQCKIPNNSAVVVMAGHPLAIGQRNPKSKA